MTTLRVSVAGASGFVGGELLRWLVDHPAVELVQATSESRAGQPIARTHPHMRPLTGLATGPLVFSRVDELEPVDVLFTAFPHGFLADRIELFAQLAERIIDCSADFRLRELADYERWYGAGGSHAAPEWLDRFTYGLPELHAPELVDARYASGVGCNATAVQLALLPLRDAGLLESGTRVIAEAKVGSSEGGASAHAGSHHPIRSGCVRAYAPTGHRHLAEVEQSFPDLEIQLSVTAVEMVRGVAVACHLVLDESVAEVVDERALLRVWRATAAERPFLDVVHERSGSYRHPEPKLVAGTNRAQIGFAYDPDRRHLVSLCALDNLGKGAAGSAVQCMNLMCGLDETAGLLVRPFHPV